MKLLMLENKLNKQKLNVSQQSAIKGGDDKRGGFPGQPNPTPGSGTHSGSINI